MPKVKSHSLTLSDVLSIVGHEKRDGKHKCPACGKWHLVLSEKSGKVLVKCWTPTCPQGAAWQQIARSAKDHRPRFNQTEERTWPGLTLVDFAQQKGFKLEWLKLFGIYEKQYIGKPTGGAPVPVVCFPYGTEINGQWFRTGTKVRAGDSHQTLWEKGEQNKYIATPYGLCLRWLLLKPDIVICEGESDTITLNANNVAALGMPGANSWRPEFAELEPLRRAERIFVVKEADDAGTSFVEKVTEDLPSDKVHILEFSADAPDPNALYLKCLQAAPPQEPPESPLPDGAGLDREEENLEAVTAHRRRLLQDGKWNPHAVRDRFRKELQARLKSVKRAFRLTDTGNAERLVAAHGQDFRWLTDEGTFCVWTGTVWGKEPSGDSLLPWTKDVVRSIEDPKWQKISESAGKRHAMITMIKGETSVLATRELFDRDRMLLNVQNGTIDLKTQQLQRCCREDYITKKAPVTFDASAKCPKFDEFLEFIFDGDADLVHFIAKALGYTLTGEIGEHCFFICHGTGANGKSTLFELMQLLMGDDYASSAKFSTFVESRFADTEGYDVATFPGRRMITASEPPKSLRLNEELLKHVTGGDLLKARQIYGRPFSFYPECKLWLAMNQQPRIAGTDEGIWRRVRYVPFNVKVPDSKKIKDFHKILLAEEAPGILNRLLEGVRDWQSEGLNPPRAVERATADFRAAQDVIQGFMNEHTIAGKRNEHVKAGDIYARYQTWCNTTGEYPMRQNEFFEELQRRGYERRTLHGSVVHYFGLRLKGSPQEETNMEQDVTV